MCKPQLLICTLEIVTYVLTQYSLTDHSFSIEINIQQTNIQLKPSPLYHHQHLCFNSSFPDKHGSAISRFLGAKQPSCHPTNSVKAQKETQVTDPTHCPHPFFNHHHTPRRGGTAPFMLAPVASILLFA